jgi:hypothetical protein
MIGIKGEMKYFLIIEEFERCGYWREQNKTDLLFLHGGFGPSFVLWC